MAEAAVNGGVSTLASDITNVATTITIQSGDVGRFPASGTYRLMLTDGTHYEICTVTGGQGTASLTVARASEAYGGTQTAFAFAAATPTSIVPVLTIAGLQALIGQTNANSLLANGGFEIWQRGNGPFTTHNTYAADKWLLTIVGTDTLSVSRETTTVDNSYASAACAYVLGNGGTTTLVHKIKLADNLEQIRGRTVAFSIRVRTSTANAVRAILSQDSGSTFAYSSYHSGGGTFETLTVTLAVSASATGSLWSGIMFSASCTAYLDNAMFVIGTTPADYAPLHPSHDLMRCYRYYQTYGGLTTNERLGTGQAFSATSAETVMVLPVTMAVTTPTLTFSTASDWATRNAGGSLQSATVLSGVPTAKDVAITITVASGLVAGDASQFISNNTNARVILEANP